MMVYFLKKPILTAEFQTLVMHCLFPMNWLSVDVVNWLNTYWHTEANTEIRCIRTHLFKCCITCDCCKTRQLNSKFSQTSCLFGFLFFPLPLKLLCLCPYVPAHSVHSQPGFPHLFSTCEETRGGNSYVYVPMFVLSLITLLYQHGMLELLFRCWL